MAEEREAEVEGTPQSDLPTAVLDSPPLFLSSLKVAKVATTAASVIISSIAFV